MEQEEEKKATPCPVCGNRPVRKVMGSVLSVTCPKCPVTFYNHVRFGCQADALWEDRARELKAKRDKFQDRFHDEQELRTAFPEDEG